MVAEVLLEIIKIIFPAAIVFATSYFLLKGMLDKESKMRLYEIRKRDRKETMAIRLQAYERLALLLERISPGNLIPRVRQSGMSARALQIELMANIRAEFEHNLSQQIYVSSELWDTINIAKNQTLKVINLVSASIPEDADSLALSKAILDYYIQAERSLPTEKALDMLKIEVKELFGR